MTQAIDHPAPLPLHDENAEQTLLGLILTTGAHAATEAFSILAPEDLYLPKHQTLCAAVARLHTAGDEIGPVTVLEELRTSGDLARAGGGHYLFTLMDAVALGVSVARTAEIIATHAACRRLEAALTHARQIIGTADLDRLDEACARARDVLDTVTLPDQGCSWDPEDLTAAVSGTEPEVLPDTGSRTDGAALFYPGRVHSVAAAPEAGKTWLALHAAAQELVAGRTVTYVDFEDSAAGIVGRLRALGVAEDTIVDRFAYIRPRDPLPDGRNRERFLAHLDATAPSLVVLDGATEAMALHGLDLIDNSDIAEFIAMLPRTIAATGSAMVMLDHLPKNREAGDRYSIGGQHKLAAIDGAAYVLDNRSPFGGGRTGRTGIYLAKDRPGAVRAKSWRHASGLSWYGDLVVESVVHHGQARLNVAIDPPDVVVDGAERGFRPTVLMARVSEALTRAGEPLSARGICDRVSGRHEAVRTALAALVDEGFVAVEEGSRRAVLHRLVRPFQEDRS